ncbi:hypothetical protein D1007_37480 [Hordeum vulgare]|nr:hypothetical protein D1007_37480 [Hordeum vulgare]
MDEKKEEEKNKMCITISPRESDKVALKRFVREHMEYVQAEAGDWKPDSEQKMKKEDEASPSMVIPVEYEWSVWDASKKEEKPDDCDNPNKDELWKQFKSSR